MKQKPVLHLNVQQLQDISFWNDSMQIEGYCQGVLLYFNIEDVKINIRFSNSEISAEQDDDKIFTILLPKIPYIDDSNKDLKNAHIYSRAVYLKHELAHIIFTFPEIDWLDLICDR